MEKVNFAKMETLKTNKIIDTGTNRKLAYEQVSSRSNTDTAIQNLKLEQNIFRQINHGGG